MKETGEVSGASDDPGEVKRAEGMQEADDETEDIEEASETSEAAEAAEIEARKDVRVEVAMETVNTVGGEFGTTITPVIQNVHENREHWKIQAEAAIAKIARKLGKTSEE